MESKYNFDTPAEDVYEELIEMKENGDFKEAESRKFIEFNEANSDDGLYDFLSNDDPELQHLNWMHFRDVCERD
jgi:uncharacterized beta-barrel protein YwiB (DUF1934 family)